MIRWTDNVNFNGLRGVMVIAAIRVFHIYDAIAQQDAWVTSANDGKHTPNSKHYKGLALDFRTHNLNPDQRKKVFNELRKALGTTFTVLLEDENQPNEHLHIQFNGD